MSFILDALKKSENERQQQSGGEFSSVPTSPADARPARWFWLLAALLAINVAVLLGILMRPDVRTTAALDDVALAPSPAAEIPAAETSAAASSFEEQVAEARRQQPDPVVQAVTTPAPAAATQPSAPAPAPAAASGERLRTIEELRLDGSLQLPELHIDIHVYSDNPDDRFVFINMAKHRERSRLDEGPVVEEITADGVILHYQGRSFLLSRE